MTGIGTAFETAAVSSQSKPWRVPSRSIEVSRISPAPRSAASVAHSTASRSRARLAASHVHQRPSVNPLGIDRDDDRLAAVAGGERGDERRDR